MERTPQQRLEELIHRELSKLSERPAPESLIPKVLARIQAREQRRWWQRPWTQWSLAWQLAFLPFLLASAVGAVLCASAAWKLAFATVSFGAIGDYLGGFADAWDVLGDLGNAVLILGRAVGQEWLLLALLVPLSMYLTCVGLGTLFYRAAFQRR
jgi:hypothetical protein